MSYNFLPYDQKQLLLLAPSLQEWVKESSLARFISDLVDVLDKRGELQAFYAPYRVDGWGRAAYPPVMMLKVLLYGYAVGVRSSRKLAQALELDVAFRYLAANLQPDFRTVSDFRKDNLAGLEALFGQVLRMCREAGLVKLGQVALDGRRVAGNAALERSRTRAELEAYARKILKEAQDTDRAEDALYGADQRGDELPRDLQNVEGRRAAIERALDELKQPEQEIRDAHEKKMQARAEKERQTGKSVRGRRPKLNEKKIEQLRANLTDPQSRMMKSRKGFVQGYNGQVMVDCSSQVIVAQDLRQEAVDWHLLKPMLETCTEQAGGRPQICIADSGYWSETNAALEDERTTLYIAVGSSAQFEGRPRKKQRKQAPKSGPHAVRMRARLSSEEGKKIYKLRSAYAEPVFGQMYERGLNRILLRGFKKARAEWSLWCTTHNLLKLWRIGALAPV